MRLAIEIKHQNELENARQEAYKDLEAQTQELSERKRIVDQDMQEIQTIKVSS